MIGLFWLGAWKKCRMSVRKSIHCILFGTLSLAKGWQEMHSGDAAYNIDPIILEPDRVSGYCILYYSIL